MKITEILLEHKKSRRAKKYNVKPEQPRNFVAKNAVMSGAGPHKDKKKAVKQGDVKHKKKELAVAEDATTPDSAARIAEIETHIAHLEKLLPSVIKISRDNHYVFEEIQSDIGIIENAVEELGDVAYDMKDAIEQAVEAVRHANGSLFNLEKTMKELIRHANMEIEDIEASDEWERRYGNGAEKTEESIKFPMAGNYKQGPAGQWSNKGSKKNRPAKRGDLVGGST